MHRRKNYTNAEGDELYHWQCFCALWEGLEFSRENKQEVIVHSFTPQKQNKEVFAQKFGII